MRRLLATALVLAAAGAFALVTTGAGNNDSQRSFWVELDNAFGLVGGADVKIAGVRAGKIEEMKIDERSYKALVKIGLPKGDFSALRTDVYCESKPQSLIGEYFIDCQPGKAQTELKDGGRIPVDQTTSTIPADLVNNILRLPQRERLRIILNEFGTGLAGRGDDLNEAIRRGVPALRQADRLLAILARQSRVLADLTTNADTVITALANNRRNVGRFVVEARDTAVASAERDVEIQQTFANFPGFLAQLQPAMRELGRVADEQTPALRDLDAASGQLTRFFDNLGPFAEASRPFFRSLGEASKVGSEAVRAARPTVLELRRFARNTPELGKNLAIILEDLYDRNRAVEPDARSPGGKGYNGLEAILGYVFWQSQAINIFDKNGYILKVALYDNECSAYRNAESVKNDPELAHECASTLGPNQPGINQPDPSTRSVSEAAKLEASERTRARNAEIVNSGVESAGPAAPQPGSPGPAARAKPPIDLSATLGGLLNGLPQAPVGGSSVPKLPADPAAQAQSTQELLDYLFGR